MTFQGRASDNGTRINRASFIFKVTDEYGVVLPSGAVQVMSDRSFSFGALQELLSVSAGKRRESRREEQGWCDTIGALDRVTP